MVAVRNRFAPVVNARPRAVRLAFAALILTGTALADKFGHRRVFLAGIAAFTLALAAYALVPSVAAVAMPGEDYAAGKFAQATGIVQTVTGRHRATVRAFVTGEASTFSSRTSRTQPASARG